MDRREALQVVRAEIALRAAHDDADAVRARCQSLVAFMQEAWPVLEPTQPYVHGWVMEAICEHLEAVTNGEITRLLINCPPGMSKSLITGVFWPAWEWGPRGRPGTRIVGSSYSEEYAKRDNRRMRDLIASEWFQSLWPITLTNAGETYFANTDRGFRQAIPFSRLTGGRGNRVIVDDPISSEQAESETDRRTAARITTESLPSRLNDLDYDAIVMIMQRLHAEDPAGIILKRPLLKYEHLMLPMEFEPERACATKIGFRDPRTEAGQLLFPERFTRNAVDVLKASLLEYGTAGQLQQRPAPREGGLFKRSWFERVPAVPRSAKTVRAWDLGASRKGDYTAGAKMALDRDGTFYIVSVNRFRLEAHERDREIKSTAETDTKRCRVRLPQDPGQAGKSQASAFGRLLPGWMVTILPVTGSKEVRATPLASQAAVGNVKIVSTGDEAEDAWIEPFLSEIEIFPAGTHDDQVDAAADAFNQLAEVGPGEGLWDYIRQAAEEQAEADSGIEHPDDLTKLIAPVGITTAYGQTGRKYDVQPDRTIRVTADDLQAFITANPPFLRAV